MQAPHPSPSSWLASSHSSSGSRCPSPQAAPVSEELVSWPVVEVGSPDELACAVASDEVVGDDAAAEVDDADDEPDEDTADDVDEPVVPSGAESKLHPSTTVRRKGWRRSIHTAQCQDQTSKTRTRRPTGYAKPHLRPDFRFLYRLTSQPTPNRVPAAPAAAGHQRFP